MHIASTPCINLVKLSIFSEVTEETVKESSLPTRSGSPPKPQSQEPLPTSLLERREDCIPELIEKAEDKESQMEAIPEAKVSNREGK